MKKSALVLVPALALFAFVGVYGCFSTVQVPEPLGAKLTVEKGKFPHEVFDGVVKKHVDGQGRVDYVALAADRDDLVRYIGAIASVSPHSNPELFETKEEQLAYWINAYNAYVLFAVTERPRMVSVNDDKTDFFFFTEYRLGGESMSLYDLENEVVRKEFSEPRIHFALNCASGSCPELPPEAFVPARLEAQLARESKKYCASDNVKLEGNVVKMSQIFEWYKADFEAGGGAIAFCRAWGRDDLPADGRLEYIPYDWSLNAQPGKALFQ